MANYGKDWWRCLYSVDVGDVKKRCLEPGPSNKRTKLETIE